MPHYAGTGKWRKQAQGAREDRQHLVTFQKAVSVFETSKKGYNGLGLAMMPEWGLVAVDFDDCVTDGVIVPEVEGLIEPTYWEFSPSGKGIRAFFKGQLRDRKSISDKDKERDGREWGVEFFCHKGFVTVTGNVSALNEIVGPGIVELTPEIKALYDRAFGSEDVNVENSAQQPVGMTDEEIEKMLKL